MAHPSTHAIRPISAGGSNAGQPKSIAYTEFPPFRFSAEFPNPRLLKEKKRVYSRTVSYAGSLWNIYIQKVRSAKNVQLGVYLHRAKEREGDDNTHGDGLAQQATGSVDERIGQLEREMILRSERRQQRRMGLGSLTDPGLEDDTSGSGGDADAALVSAGPRNSLLRSNWRGRRSGTMPRLSSPRSAAAHLHNQNRPVSPPTDGESTDSPFFPLAVYSPSDHASDQTDESEDDYDSIDVYPNPSSAPVVKRKSSILPSYVDGRPTIRTYFKIYSPSKGGRMLSIYESAPDRFNFSQSWGWKSSTLMLDEVAINGGVDDPSAAPETLAEKKREGKLRFMVVIGNL